MSNIGRQAKFYEQKKLTPAPKIISAGDKS